ncbi:hypothetical protein J3Q64DRAFT_1629571 [Phycomyces blakesleeanus]|uniref:SET domain-containing protein n=1 Tax=Phycomyces blakesleeanus TaxID=4837 RepID=A0ABR3BHX8_PHYBL
MTDLFEKTSEIFWKWLESNGATLSENIEIGDYRSEGAGRGITAKNDIKEGEILFSLPRSLLLSPLTSRLRQEPGIGDKLDNLEGWLPLILCMMYESQKPDSFWKPYFDILPKTFSTPMFWGDDDIKGLEGTDIVGKIGKSDAEAMFESNILPIIKSNPILFDENIHTVELFHICGSLIMAYSFTDEVATNANKPIKNKEDEDEDEDDEDEDEDEDEEGAELIAMVPLADTLNHKTGFNNARLFHEPEFLEMKAFKDIRKGEQIYNTYGDLCNADLLRKYGFVDEPNEFDIVEINGADVVSTFSNPEENEEVTGRKLEFLMEEGVLDDCFVLENDHEIPEALIIIAHVLKAPVAEFDKMEAKQKLPKAKQTPEIMRPLMELFERRLAKYPCLKVNKT